MKIYNASGVEILDIQVDDSSVRYRSIMADDSLTLQFSTTGPVTVPRGAYVDFEGVRYTLFYPENFKKNSTRDFAYTLVLHGNKEWLKFCLYRDRSAKPYRSKFKLTATPGEFIQLLIDNLSAKYGGGWSIGDCIEATETYLSFNIESCYDVLNRLAQEFSTEWEIIGKTIHFRKVEKFKDDPLPLSYGLGNGFKTGIGRQNDGDRQPIGQLDVEGGERNIDYSTYGSNTLLLPKSATLVYEGKTYRTDADGMYITRDGNTNIGEAGFDGSKFYPKRVGTVSHVIVVDADSHFYDIRDTSIPAALNYRDCRIPGEKATIVFQSGALAGREFDIEQTDTDLTGYIHAERRFKIVPAELDGQIMPGGAFVPQVGDKYAIFNIRMPEAYISDDATKTGASWDMFREAVKYFAEEENDKFSFTGELDGVWSRSRWLEIGGKIVPGGHVLFSDPQFQPDGVLIRITAIKDYVNKPHKPEITLSNAPVPGSFSSDLGKLEAEEVVREADKKDLIRYSKRQWRDAKETMSMLQEALLNFSGSINPLTVQTMQLLVGDESLQFRFVNSKTNPQPVTHNVAFNTTTKVLTAVAGIIQHMTIGITSMKKSHAASEYKYWDMSTYTSPALDPEKAYYLYARCATSGTTGIFLLSETVIGMESVANQYHFLLGILNSEQDDDRSFAPLYGYTEILPGRITADRIVSQDGQTYFDLLDGIIGGRIKFLSSGVETDLETWASEVDNLEIGGVNILLNSKATKSGTAYNIGYWDSVRDFVPGEELTVTIKGNIPGSRLFGLWFNTSSLGTGSIPKLEDGYYQKKLTVPAATNTRRVGLYLIGNQSAGDNWEFEWIKLESGDKVTLEWSAPTEELKASIEETKSYAEAVMDNVADLDTYINNAFKDGVIDAAEAKAIEKSINLVNETMAKAEASYNKVYANTYLEGTAKTNLLNAKINLWGQRDTLLSAINTAISGGSTTPAQKTAVDNAFNSFNSLMSAFQNALEDANKAIQTKLDSLSTNKADSALQSANNYTINQLKRTEATVDARSLDINTYYPVVIKMSASLPYRIKLYRTLTGAKDGIPSWSTHANGFSVNCEWTSIGSGWETIPVRRFIERFSYQYVPSGSPVGSINQMTNSSYEYIYVRGGSRYHFIVEGATGAEVSLKTSTYTVSSQSISPVTSVVAPVINLDAINTKIQESAYLKSALRQATEIVGGLILSSIIAGRDATEIVRSYLNGNPNLNPIAFAAGVENFGMTNETQKNALRHDGSGFLANKKIEWDVNGNTDYSGNLKGVSGTFKTLNCVDNNGNIVGSIKFGSDGRIWFENCSIAHQAATGAFLTSDVWIRGVLGSRGKTALVITGPSYGYVYKGGLGGSSQYISLSSGTASDSNTYYNIPLYSPTTESSGMPIDLVIINHGSTARYNLPYIPGKTVAMVNSRDQNSNIYIYTNGRTIQMNGGLGITMACVGSNQNPDNSSWLGRGWLITGYNDNQWT